MSKKQSEKSEKSEKKFVPRRFRGALAKKFPRTFQYRGKEFIINEDQKKYLNNHLNILFLENEPHAVALDRYGDCLPLRNRKVQKTFSTTLRRIGPNEKKSRTLALKD